MACQKQMAIGPRTDWDGRTSMGCVRRFLDPYDLDSQIDQRPGERARRRQIQVAGHHLCQSFNWGQFHRCSRVRSFQRSRTAAAFVKVKQHSSAAANCHPINGRHAGGGSFLRSRGDISGEISGEYSSISQQHLTLQSAQCKNLYGVCR